MNNYFASLLVSSNLLTILVSIFISITIICECYGYFFRLIGLKLGKAALGYSIHVQCGTFGRIGNIIGATLLSYGIESNLIEVQKIAFFSILILISSLLLIVFSNKVELIIISLLNDYFTKWIREKKEIKSSKHELVQYFRKYQIEDKKFQKKVNKNNILYFGIPATIAMFFTLGGYLIAFKLAETNFNYRMTALSLSPFMTSIGTLISITFVDPKLSLIDKSKLYRSQLMLLFKSRILSLFLIFIIFIFI